MSASRLLPRQMGAEEFIASVDAGVRRTPLYACVLEYLKESAYRGKDSVSNSTMIDIHTYLVANNLPDVHVVESLLRYLLASLPSAVRVVGASAWENAFHTNPVWRNDALGALARQHNLPEIALAMHAAHITKVIASPTASHKTLSHMLSHLIALRTHRNEYPGQRCKKFIVDTPSLRKVFALLPEDLIAACSREEAYFPTRPCNLTLTELLNGNSCGFFSYLTLGEKARNASFWYVLEEGAIV